jgi:hypothetical protein
LSKAEANLTAGRFWGMRNRRNDRIKTGLGITRRLVR